MADTKISALTAASTPLAGTEVLPIVQSSTTKKVAVSDLTAGRSVSAASLSLTTTPLAVTSGGTGLATVAQGDLLYGSASNTLSALAKNTTATRYLTNTGTSNNPAWAQVDLTNGVAGVLPVANGGTNASSASITAFNNITGYTASGATGTTSTNLVFSTSPSLTTPRVITSINDTNGNELFGITATASAVNELTIANAATGNKPTISATGGDTNIGITITPKGTGDLTLSTGNLIIGTSGKGIAYPVTSGGTSLAPAFRAYLAANQNPTAGVLTKISFANTSFDTASAFDTTNYRFVPQVAGYYQINAQADLGGSASYFLQIYKNGASTGFGFFSGATAVEMGASVSSLIYLNGSTDYVEVYARAGVTAVIYGSASGNVTVFDGCLVRAA